MILAIVQARMGSTRFPGKVMKLLAGKPLIGFLLERLSRSKHIDKIIIATSINANNDDMCKYVEQVGYEVFRGNETDVLDRFFQAAKKYRPTTIVRITGDCPLIDYRIVDKVIIKYQECNVDYASNIDPPTFPDGLDTEVFSFSALEKAWTEASHPREREHVTPYIRENKEFKKTNVANINDDSNERWTVDEPEDYDLVKSIINELMVLNPDFSSEDVMHLKQIRPEIFNKNSGFFRNEGANMSSGQKMWSRAKRVIAGGNSLLSKRPDMFLPDAWPSYFDRAKGIDVWDLDGNKYIDMTIMGIGTNTLGYANEEVDAKVIEAIKKSNVSTLNCPEEVSLAEKLIELHPWAEMVRYSRTGGEACAIAVRIARAACGKDKIAFCGYHGWHDWYLASNLSDNSNLDGQLLPGLEPKGVPRGLNNTMYPFNYGDINALIKIVELNDIGTIIMEPVRNSEPQNDFLQKVRKLASDKNIILIFDEITSGFRRTVGGIHKYYHVNPDMAVLGKAMGNGYAISAILGKKEQMESVQKSFISSTFWTERIGPTAALETIRILERDNVPEGLEKKGFYINECWQQLANKHNLSINIEGLPALTHFSFPGQNNLLIKSIITQEMLKKGYLAATSVYVCNQHLKSIVDEYIENLDSVFGLIKTGIENKKLEDLLKGPICQSGFKRLI